tara:strand:- start:3 stop:182 length:180 start_codon:yes stop_codon:yes gene_type:complete
LPSPRYFKHPTIDLTCWCKKDFETKDKIILFFSFLTEALLRVLTGDLASQDEDRNVEKL